MNEITFHTFVSVFFHEATDQLKIDIGMTKEQKGIADSKLSTMKVINNIVSILRMLKKVT